MAKTSKGLHESTITRMQELASAWVFKRAIEDSKGWQRYEHIKKDEKTFNEIKKIWKTVGNVEWIDNIDDEWLESFYKQQRVLLRKIGRPNITLFTRDGAKQPNRDAFPWQKRKGASQTFMEWVEWYIKGEFGIGNKDNWNPADIWLIQDEKKWKDRIKDATSMKGMKKTPGLVKANLLQFNSIFRALFRTKNIIGISLKKIGSGKRAEFKEVNVSGKFFKMQQEIEMKYDEAICKCGTKPIGIDKKGMIDLAKEDYAKRKGKEKGLYRGLTGLATLETQDSRINVKYGSKTFSFQIKTTSSTSYDNLKFEPTEKGKGAARMGKATREFVIDLMESWKFKDKWPEKNGDYPKTIEQFDGVDERTYEFTSWQKEYLEKLEFLDKEGVELGVTPLEALINIKETFGPLNQPYVANSKLQQINFLWAFLSTCKTHTERNKFCTDLVFLASKEGKDMKTSRYGPFGKIY